MADYSDENNLINFVKNLIDGNKTQDMILKCIKKTYNISWSKSTLKRFMKKNEIFRYDRNLLPSDVISAIETELKGTAGRLGYRLMWTRLRRRGILVTRDQVANCMKLIGAEKDAPAQRRKHHPNYFSKGPNYTWHVDGNYKLAKWGFYIHGAVDGYSRKVLWLRLFTTNKDPWLISKYFIEAVEEYQGCPTRLRCDPGTENMLVGKCQMFLRRHGMDSLSGADSYYEGSSVNNQPIESFWRYFREQGMQVWIDHFKGLQLNGKWNPGNTIHQLCLLYVYMPLLKKDANEMQEDWNSHRIRFQKDKNRPNGIPNELYEFPAAVEGHKEMKKGVSRTDITFIKEKYDLEQELVFLPQSFKKEADLFIQDSGRDVNSKNAASVYEELVAHFSQ